MPMTELQQAKRLFPRYKGRTLRDWGNQKTVSLYGRYWDSGSFREYCLLRKDGTSHHFPGINPFHGDHHEQYELQEGEVMYIHVYSGTRQFIQVIHRDDTN